MSANWLLIIFSISVPIYWAWRLISAINARKQISGEVDAYLGENHSEMLKKVVFKTYEDALKYSLPWRVVFSLIFQSNDTTHLKALIAESGEDESREAFKLMAKITLVNIRLAPLSYLTILSIIAVYVFARIVLGKSLGFANNCRDRMEEAFLNTVH